MEKRVKIVRSKDRHPYCNCCRYDEIKSQLMSVRRKHTFELLMSISKGQTHVTRICRKHLLELDVEIRRVLKIGD